MYARTITAALVPGKADEAVQIYNEQIVPMMKQQPGYVRSTMLIDRDGNQAMTISVWESREAAASTGEGTSYLAQALELLRGSVVPKTFHHWEVGTTDR
jgi:heme-degrading monooxygenase HmoA